MPTAEAKTNTQSPSKTPISSASKHKQLTNVNASGKDLESVVSSHKNTRSATKRARSPSTRNSSPTTHSRHLSVGERMLLEQQRQAKEKAAIRKENEKRDRHKMHLLEAKDMSEVDIDSQLAKVKDFDVCIEPRDIMALMSKYEEQNTGLLMDVNMREDEIVEFKRNSQESIFDQIKSKIQFMDQNIRESKRRLIEAKNKNDYLMAPKNAELKRLKEL